MKCVLKNPVFEALTFDELVEHGKASGAHIVNGMPWSFQYRGRPVSHETDDRYLVAGLRFARGDMLVMYQGDVEVFTADEFAEQYVAQSSPYRVADAGCTLQEACHDAAFGAGWWKDTETGEDVRTWPPKFFALWVSAKLMLVVTEVAEAMEGHRKSKMDDKLPHRTMLEVELADAVIRCCDLAGGLKLDLGGAIAEKMSFNAHRPDHKLEARMAEGGKSI